MNTVTTKLWTLYAKSYDGLLWFWPYRHLLDLMVRRAAIGPQQSLLDLGCGTANLINTIAVSQPQAKFTGIDISPGMLKVARRKLRTQLADGSAALHQVSVMDFLIAQPSASYDVITSMNVLYTIADQKSLWRELMRVIKPGGKIVITTSVETGSAAIIREHFEHSSIIPLLRPKLLAVFVIDALINVLGRTGHFAFSDQAKLSEAVTLAGGKMHDVERCYGGQQHGVNIIFTVK